MPYIILFDQNTLHYRQSIYRYFREELKKDGYNLIVVYDKKLNKISCNIDFFIGINYSFHSFYKIMKKYDCRLIIQFVWLRYRFLIPLMIFNRIRGIKTIVWSHGINLQNKKQVIKNQFYYLRQYLANALILYSKNEIQYIKAKLNKVFIANNTLNFYEFPNISSSKNELKKKYGLENKKIVLCVGRMDSKNRKIDYLISGFKRYPHENVNLIIVGSGYTDIELKRINKSKNIIYFGEIIDPVKISEIYKMSNVFCMPGPIGLAINQAFYYGLPIVIEDVEHSPEIVYFKEGINGYLFQKSNVDEMMNKIMLILDNNNLLSTFSKNARRTILNEASIEIMFNGFKKVINYVK